MTLRIALLPKQNKGDTIVEVMIAIIVLSAALAAAFAIAGNSQKRTQANHEYSQAVLLANNQAELLLDKYKSEPDSATKRDDFYDLFASKSCMVGDTVLTFNLADCTVEPYLGGARYEISIDRLSLPPPDAGNYFLITVQWDTLAGPDRGNVELRYGI